MFYTIYRITNTVNGKTYIGKHQTDNIDDGYFGSGKYLKRAIKKYGREKFTKEILHVFETEEEMNLKEKELVVLSESSYNLCPGGQGGWGYINKNRTKDESSKFGRLGGLLSSGMSGKYHSRKSRDLISDGLIGNTNTKGRSLTEQHKKKISLAMRGKNLNNKSHLGKKHSALTKRKISLSLKKHYLMEGW